MRDLGEIPQDEPSDEELDRRAEKIRTELDQRAKDLGIGPNNILTLNPEDESVIDSGQRHPSRKKEKPAITPISKSSEKRVISELVKKKPAGFYSGWSSEYKKRNP